MSDVTLRFGAKDDGIAAQFRRVNKEMDEFAANAKGIANSIGSTFKALGLAGLATAAASAVKQLVSESLEFADAVIKVQQQTGFATDEVQRLMFIAGQADVELGSLTSGVLKLQKMLGGLEEGSAGAAKELERLGIANATFFASSPEDQFNTVARAIAGISDQNERVAATTALFGKSGGELIPVLVAIGNESAALEAKFDSIGGAVGEEAIKNVERLGDEMATTAVAAKSLATEILAIFATPADSGQGFLQETFGTLRFLVDDARRKLQGLRGDTVTFRHSTDEVILLSEQIDELREKIANPGIGGSIFDTADSIAKRLADSRRELDELLRKQEVILGVGAGGIQPRLESFPVVLDQPGDFPVEESDAARKEREELEEKRAQQRLAHLADVQLIERDMTFKHNQELEGITQERLEREILAEANKSQRVANVQTDAQEFLANVRKTFGLQEIKLEEIKSQSILEIASGMFGALAGQNTKLAKLQQGIALAQTIWSTATGIMKAFETLPWPASLVAAAKVAITGAIQVAKIKSTNYSAGSVSGSAPTLAGGGSSVGASRDTQTTQPEDFSGASGATTVYISGAMTPALLDYFFEGLREGFDRDVIVIPQSSMQAQVIRGNA